MNETLYSAIFSSPSDNLVFSAFFEFEMKKSGPFSNIIWKGASYFQLFKISRLLLKN